GDPGSRPRRARRRRAPPGDLQADDRRRPRARRPRHRRPRQHALPGRADPRSAHPARLAPLRLRRLPPVHGALGGRTAYPGLTCSDTVPAMNAEPAHAGKLRRSVGFWGLMFVSLGSIIGSGWLLGALQAAQVAGPASVLSWLLSAGLLSLLALTY